MTTIQTANGTLEAAFVYHPGDGADLYFIASQVAIIALAHKRPVAVVRRVAGAADQGDAVVDDLIKIYWTRK